MIWNWLVNWCVKITSISKTFLNILRCRSFSSMNFHFSNLHISLFVLSKLVFVELESNDDHFVLIFEFRAENHDLLCSQLFMFQRLRNESENCYLEKRLIDHWPVAIFLCRIKQIFFRIESKMFKKVCSDSSFSCSCSCIYMSNMHAFVYCLSKLRFFVRLYVLCRASTTTHNNLSKTRIAYTIDYYVQKPYFIQNFHRHNSFWPNVYKIWM